MQPLAIQAAWRGAERCQACAIRHLVLFANLDQPDFQRIHLPIDEVEFDAGRVLYRQGDQGASVFTVRAGLVKLVQRLPNGDRRIVRLLRQGDVAGLERTLGRAVDHDAIALSPVSACRIPLQVIETLSRDTPHLHRCMLDRWQRALSDADLWITELSTGKAVDRVARLLLYLREACGDPQFLLPTRDDMGAMLGLTAESVSKVTADFKRRGLLRLGGAGRADVDLDGLRRIAAR